VNSILRRAVPGLQAAQQPSAAAQASCAELASSEPHYLALFLNWPQHHQGTKMLLQR
jgi:hypothetical protein